VTIPPLRDRGGDIELLAKHFLQEFSQDSYRTNVNLSPQTLAVFQKYNWPGNCREMQNVIQYALVKCQEDTIKPEHLPVTLFAGGPNEYVRNLRKSKIDEQAILAALQKTGGNKRQAAEVLGVSRSTLYRFFDRHRRQS
ncbi:MAG: helix-turn-helix domain-containing protein, partial [Desulfobacteraceae bacterium]|jgi:transcriptional regulator with PAS, ATPase and Fis domain|nr:helix-turn-helix domain-containing protein [Desulfobacteraceae bacterium]